MRLRFPFMVSHDGVGQVSIRTILMTGLVDFSKLDEKRRRRCGEISTVNPGDKGNDDVEMEGKGVGEGRWLAEEGWAASCALSGKEKGAAGNSSRSGSRLCDFCAVLQFSFFFSWCFRYGVDPPV